MKKPFVRALLSAGAFLSMLLHVVPSQAASWELEAEGGSIWFGRNEVRIPGDTGTRFDMLDLTGAGPDGYGRALVTFHFNPRHALRLTLAPLETEGTGRLGKEVRFEDVVFPGDADVRGTYRFNTYRLAYRWTFLDAPRWVWGLGAAALVRDAEISLEQGDLRASKDDLGIVPLLHLRGEWRWTERLSILADVEGAAASQGRAIDAVLQARWHFRSGAHLSAGYRILEGGADNDDVYTFAELHHLLLAAGWRF